MNRQIVTVCWRCKCNELNFALVRLPAPLDPLDSDEPIVESVSMSVCTCGRSCDVRMTVEAMPNQAWARETP